MAIPLKAISIAFCGRGLIFEGLKEFLIGLNDEFCHGFRGETLKDQPAAMFSGIFFEISPFGEQPSRLPKIRGPELAL
jgi:hypothetical protein